MRTILILFFFFIWLSGQSQTLSNREVVDTAFYESGQIRTIAYSKNAQTTLLFPGDRKLIKIVYQYDECNNLRNTTNIFEVYIDLNSYGVMNPSRYQEEDHFMTITDCNKKWTKPILAWTKN